MFEFCPSEAHIEVLTPVSHLVALLENSIIEDVIS